METNKIPFSAKLKFLRAHRPRHAFAAKLGIPARRLKALEAGARFDGKAETGIMLWIAFQDQQQFIPLLNPIEYEI